MFLYYLFAHWLADFAVQTHYQAENKSKSNLELFYHCFSYTLVVSFLIFMYDFPHDMKLHDKIATVVLIPIGIFIIHFITDFITSRIVSSYFSNKDYHNGFVVIGFDQFLHAAQLYAVMNILN